MKQAMERITVKGDGRGFVDVTATLAQWVGASGVRSGLLTAFVPHTSASLLKSVRFSRGTDLQFRLEVFNLFNRPNFGLPSGAVFSAGAVAGTGVVNPTYGRIISTRTTSRQIQLAARLLF